MPKFDRHRRSTPTPASRRTGDKATDRAIQDIRDEIAGVKGNVNEGSLREGRDTSGAITGDIKIVEDVTEPGKFFLEGMTEKGWMTSDPDSPSGFKLKDNEPKRKRYLTAGRGGRPIITYLENDSTDLIAKFYVFAETTHQAASIEWRVLLDSTDVTGLETGGTTQTPDVVDGRYDAGESFTAGIILDILRPPPVETERRRPVKTLQCRAWNRATETGSEWEEVIVPYYPKPQMVNVLAYLKPDSVNKKAEFYVEWDADNDTGAVDIDLFKVQVGTLTETLLDEVENQAASGSGNPLFPSGVFTSSIGYPGNDHYFLIRFYPKTASGGAQDGVSLDYFIDNPERTAEILPQFYNEAYQIQDAGVEKIQVRVYIVSDYMGLVASADGGSRIVGSMLHGQLATGITQNPFDGFHPQGPPFNTWPYYEVLTALHEKHQVETQIIVKDASNKRLHDFTHTADANAVAQLRQGINLTLSNYDDTTNKWDVVANWRFDEDADGQRWYAEILNYGTAPTAEASVPWGALNTDTADGSLIGKKDYVIAQISPGQVCHVFLRGENSSITPVEGPIYHVMIHATSTGDRTPNGTTTYGLIADYRFRPYSMEYQLGLIFDWSFNGKHADIVGDTPTQWTWDYEGDGLTKAVDNASYYVDRDSLLGGATIATGFTVIGLVKVPNIASDSVLQWTSNGPQTLLDIKTNATTDGIDIVFKSDTPNTVTVTGNTSALAAGNYVVIAVVFDARNGRYRTVLISTLKDYIKEIHDGDLPAGAFTDQYVRIMPDGTWSSRRWLIYNRPLTDAEVDQNIIGLTDWAQQYGIVIGSGGGSDDRRLNKGSGAFPELSDLQPRMSYVYPMFRSDVDDYRVSNVAPGTRDDSSSHGRIESVAADPFRYFRYTTNGLERVTSSTSDYVTLPNAVIGGSLDDFSMFLIGRDNTSINGDRPFELSAGTNTKIQVTSSNTNAVDVTLTNSALSTFTATLNPSGYANNDWYALGLAYDHSAQSVTAWLLSDTGVVDEATATATGTMETSINYVRAFAFRQPFIRLMGFAPGKLMTLANFESNCRYVYPWLLQFGIDLAYEGQGEKISVLGEEMATEQAIKKFRTGDIRVVHWAAGPNDEQRDVQWASGTIKYADSANNVTSYSIASGTLSLTGGVGARTWIYFDPNVSTTVLQTTTTWPLADVSINYDMTLVAVCTYGKTTTQGNEKASIYNLFENQIIGASEAYINYLSSITADFGLITAGEARFGTGTVGVNFAGVRLYSSGIEGYGPNPSAETLQFTIDASDGTAHFGGGEVVLDVDGITIAAGSGAPNTITWDSGLGHDTARIYGTGDVLNLAGYSQTSLFVINSGSVVINSNPFDISIVPNPATALIAGDRIYMEGASNYVKGIPINNAPTAGYVLAYNATGPTLDWVANSGGMTSWVLAASDTAGTESITDGETVTINGSTGIDVTRSTNQITISHDWSELISSNAIASNDYLVFYDANLTAAGKRQLPGAISEILSSLATTTTVTANLFSGSAYLVIDDGGTFKRIKVEDFFKEFFADATDVVPAAADFFMILDSTDGSIKKADNIA